jgi:hypothetical protein
MGTSRSKVTGAAPQSGVDAVLCTVSPSSTSARSSTKPSDSTVPSKWAMPSLVARSRGSTALARGETSMVTAGGSVGSPVATTTVLVIEAVAPSSSVTVSPIRWQPTSSKVRVVCTPSALSPSRSQAYSTISPSGSLLSLASKVTSSGPTPLAGLAVNAAVGASFSGPGEPPLPPEPGPAAPLAPEPLAEDALLPTVPSPQAARESTQTRARAKRM